VVPAINDITSYFSPFVEAKDLQVESIIENFFKLENPNRASLKPSYHVLSS